MVYDFVATSRLPLMHDLVTRLAGLPFAPLVAWHTGAGQHGLGVGLGDLLLWSWQETKPLGSHRTYYGVTVFEGAYRYAGIRLVPSWGGSMFEALMPTLFVPEEQWGRQSWALNHSLTVQAQIHHDLQEAQYGYWGFSPATVPEGGYATYGVDGIGMNPDGYPSNNDKTFVDHGFPGCPGGEPAPDPAPSTYTNGVVTPHAAFLALRWAPEAALANLANLERDFAIYTEWGFRDSVNVDTGLVSPYYLALDQGMIMAAIGNALAHDMLREAFVTPEFRRALRRVIAVEAFNASPRSHEPDVGMNVSAVQP